ncbi:hypothetical protein N9T75_00730, partial [Bacteroidota bacterium]|nr:hypothetical protein [Bacteroidota bacterium]
MFKDFYGNWKSHGQPVNGQLKFIKENLLVVGADYFPDGMCGRAVDAQVRFINKINEEFNLDLLNRTNIAFVKDNSIVVHNYNNLDVKKNGKAIYYTNDEKDSLINEINIISCESMKIYIKENKIEKIKFNSKPNGKT